MSDIALVRGVPDSFVRALRGEPGDPLDPPLARKQLNGYIGALEAAGYAVERISPDEGYPDCVFIEDAAIVFGPVAVIARSGAASRRGETGPVADSLSRRFALEHIRPPGTLDGGDVMQIGGRVFVGRSRRTNDEGIAQLGGLLDVKAVPVREGLHLKSVVLPIDEETVLVTRDAVDESALRGLRVLYEPEPERQRASALPLRDGRLLVTENTARTVDLLAGHGFDVLPIDVSELQAADGGLTCLSIVFRVSLPVGDPSHENGGS